MGHLLPTFFIIFFCASVAHSNLVKGLDDSILFHINWPGYSEALLESPDYEKFEMITNNNEKFQCLVPISYGKITDNSYIYEGPNALELLMPLFKNKGHSCTLRLEAFWTYELCHGQHIKQYHEEKDGKASRYQEYILGVASYDQLKKQVKELDDLLHDNPNPLIPVTKIEGVNLPYFPVNYTDGTRCDLTGNPRFSRVLYVCYEEGRHAVYSVKETYTCEYEIVVLTSLLCQHPSYRPNDVPQTDLHCVSMKNEMKRPKNLLHIEAESLKLRTYGAVLDGDLTRGTVQIEVVGDDKIKIVSEITDAGDTKKAPSLPQAPFPLHSPSIDKKLVEDFLKGDYCLQGGSGWWKYEFCYGKIVHQYHEDQQGSKVVILLGIFDIEKHKQWIAEHPNKKFKEGKNQVSHFYSDGDTCEATGMKRIVEVKLKCKESDSPSSVTLYLLEPRTCEYVLGVETPIVCPLLKDTDEFGLFTLNEQIENVVDNVVLFSKRSSVEKAENVEEQTVSQSPINKNLKEGEHEELLDNVVDPNNEHNLN